MCYGALHSHRNKNVKINESPVHVVHLCIDNGTEQSPRLELVIPTFDHKNNRQQCFSKVIRLTLGSFIRTYDEGLENE